MRTYALSLTLLAGLVAGGCGNDPIVRDNYLGKAWLQPQPLNRPQPRDGNGNPIQVPDKAPETKERAAS